MAHGSARVQLCTFIIHIAPRRSLTAGVGAPAELLRAQRRRSLYLFRISLPVAPALREINVNGWRRRNGRLTTTWLTTWLTTARRRNPSFYPANREVLLLLLLLLLLL